MDSRKKVLLCALTQESNSFNPVTMPLSSFYVVPMEKNSNPGCAAARSYLIEQGVDCVCGIAMHASSGGPVADEVVNFFLEDTMQRIKSANGLDGILLVLHGATMSESCDDVCGYLCETLRKAVGDKVIISGSFDLHANITEKIAKNLDYLCGYWEYPHIDRPETNRRTAKMLCDHLFGQPRQMARATVPSIAPAHAYTTTKGALKQLKEHAQAMIASGRISDYSVFQAQPWVDTPLLSSAVITIAEDPQQALSAANELARASFESREELQGSPLISVQEVIEKALCNTTGKPIVLVDSADSIGAGSTGDSAYALAALLPYADKLFAATAVRDVPAVKKAFATGVGNTADFSLGATIAPKLSDPVRVTAKVRSLHDGYFKAYGPMSKGQTFFSGRTAVLEVGRLLIRVSEVGEGAPDANFYREFGIPLEKCALITIKACTSFRASYASFVSDIYNTATPGSAGPVLKALPFERLPHPLYPFDEITEADIQSAKLC